MPFPNYFKYNQKAKYTPDNINIKNYTGKIEDYITNFRIYVDGKNYFTANALNIFTNYIITFTTEKEVTTWRTSCNMKYWQNQLNFAVFCASSGCGISSIFHIMNPSTDIQSRSFFLFHVYYQTRRILSEMSVTLPTDKNFDELNNNINMTEFNRIANEFELDPNTDFRFKLNYNDGIGYLYDENDRKVANSYDPTKYSLDYPSGYLGGKILWHDLDRTSYGGGFGGKWIPHITKIKQEYENGWAYFVMSESVGFTRQGIERLNDSIRTYVYCVLGAQAQIRSPIIGNAGTIYDAQKQFIFDLEDCISGKGSSISIPDSIKRYQEAVNNTHSRLDYVIAPGLYMIPTDMVLKIGSIVGYNNNILIADENMKFGLNVVNTQQLPPPVPKMDDSTKFPDRPTQTDIEKPKVMEKTNKVDKPQASIHAMTHDDTKWITAILLGASFGSLVYFIK